MNFRLTANPIHQLIFFHKFFAKLILIKPKIENTENSEPNCRVMQLARIVSVEYFCTE